MKRLLACVALACGLSAPTLAQFGPQTGPRMRGDGPSPAPKPFRIERTDPGLDAVVSPGSRLTEVARGFGINEGPVWVHKGRSVYLLLSSLIDNVIYKITPTGAISVFMERAGFSGDDPSNTGFQTRSGRAHVLLVGPSCTGLDSQGRLLWCASNDNALMRLEKDGSHTILAGPTPDGRHIMSPNDITVLKDDTLYMTVNQFGFRNGRVPPGFAEAGIWMLKGGRLSLVLSAKDLGGIPNGITVSPDEKHLYANALTKLKRYDIGADGSLSNGTQIADGEGIIDGMKADAAGNIYSTSGAGPGVVRISAPDGKLLGLLRMPIVGGEPKRQICATNLAFGGADNKTMFIAACDAVYSLRLKVSGIAQGPAGR